MRRIPIQRLLSISALAGAFALLAPPIARATEHHPFDQWRALHFTEAELIDESISGPEADPAGDRVPNLAKYAFGLEPFQPSRQELPEIIWDLDRPALRFMAAEERLGVDLMLGVSGDLVDWESHLLDGTYGEWSSIAVGDGREEITVRPPQPAGGRQFLRLEVHLVGGGGGVLLLGVWNMDEIVEGGTEDRVGNLRRMVPDQSGRDNHLILGNRPSDADTFPDSGREPILVARETGFALNLDGVDDVAYVRDMWNADEPEEHFRFSFDFSPQAPLAGAQTVMITTSHHEIRLMQNSNGTHARLWFIRFPDDSMLDRAYSHWFHQEGDSLDTWYHVEGWIQNGQMQISIDGEQTDIGTYDQAKPIGWHHNTHYLGQTWLGGRTFKGLIDNLEIEALE